MLPEEEDDNAISIHALREEGDRFALTATTSHVKYFYPRPPRGGRRPGSLLPTYRSDFYPRPPRGGRHATFVLACPFLFISIHALREEGDSKPSEIEDISLVISIHALREEGDL